MSDRFHCNCQRCTIRGLRAPVIIVTVGILFLLQEMRGGFFDFTNTYPIIIIVIGILSLASTFASNEGHVASVSPMPPTMPPAPGVPPTPMGTTPPASSGQGQ